MKRLLNSLISYSELTTCRDETAWIDIHLPSYYQIDKKIADQLIRWQVVEVDSGNWETGETHYTIDPDNPRRSKLSNIQFLKNKIIPSNMDSKSDLIKNLDEIKLFEERKLKIKKLSKL